MSKELNCMNCCIGDFKHSLCDCDNGMCKEYKKIGKAEDFENEVLKRTKPKPGKWVEVEAAEAWNKRAERRENGRSELMTLKEAINQLELLRNFVFENDKDAMDKAIQVLKWLAQGTEKGTVKGMEE